MSAIPPVAGFQRNRDNNVKIQTLTQGMSELRRRHITGALAPLSPLERRTTLRNVERLITTGMGASDRFAAFRDVRGLIGLSVYGVVLRCGDIDARTALALRIISPGMDYSERSLIFNAIARLNPHHADNIVGYADEIITSNMNASSRVLEIKYVAKVCFYQREAHVEERRRQLDLGKQAGMPYILK